MELEKRMQREAKKAKAESERSAAAAREEGERDARKEALRALTEMGAGAGAAGEGGP